MCIYKFYMLNYVELNNLGLIFIFALSLAWGCNKGGERILMFIIAFIIPYLYLIGYCYSNL